MGFSTYPKKLSFKAKDKVTLRVLKSKDFQRKNQGFQKFLFSSRILAFIRGFIYIFRANPKQNQVSHGNNR